MAEMLNLFAWAAERPTEPVSPPQLIAAPLHSAQTNYRLSECGRQLASSWKARAADNMAAIRLAHELVASKAQPTDEQMQILARYVGFGATDLAQSLFPVPGTTVRQGWEQIHSELHELVDERGRASLARSTQYAHFTPDYLSRAIFDGVVRLGFKGGNALEPGCGIGLFMAAAPQSVADKITWTGVEMDPTAAMIARLLQPQANILNQDFSKTRLLQPADLVIGNPPFAATHVIGEGPAGRLKIRLHDYFIARSLELLKVGGLAAFITSAGTMDKTDPKARAYMSELATLIGAIRLPQGAMAQQAGTEVVVDILFFKRVDTPDADLAATWTGVTEVTPHSGRGEKPMLINRYFSEHPDMVLGNHAWTTSPFGPKYTCIATGEDLETAVRSAIDRIPGIATEAKPSMAFAPAAAVQNTIPAAPRPRTHSSDDGALALFATAVPQQPQKPPQLLALTRAERELDADAYELKEGSFAVIKDALYQYNDGRMEAIAVKTGRSTPGIFPKHANIIRAFITVRNALRAVITAQVFNDDARNEAAQDRLRKAYRSFVSEFGPINLTKTIYTTDEKGVETATHRRPNLAPVLDDPDCWLVASIERYDPETNRASMGPIFTEKVIGAETEATVHNAADALAAVLDNQGRVDIDAIAALLDIDRAAAIAELGDRIYALPEDPDTWVTADEYLSGNVRTKLETAKAHAADDPTFQRNVEALEKAQPADLNPSDVTARLGSPWIPTTDIEDFIKQSMGIETRVSHTVGIAAWDIHMNPFLNEPSATSEWGTKRRHSGQLIHDALNGVIPKIYDVFEEDGQEKRVLNAVDTEAAREKLTKIQDAFSSWIWTDNERTLRLMRLYNDTYNDIVPREFDGSHLQLRGSSNKFSLYPHQKRVIWRIIASGATYVAHSVGAGKTMSIAAAVMEQRRLGLISKPILVVPGHCLAQFTVEWLQLYPTAQLLVADEQNFAKDKRARFVARATTGNWDCIIITHSAFKLIPSPTAFEEEMIEDALAQLESMTESLKAGDNNDRTSRKRLEQRKEALRMRLEALHGRKDNMVTIAEMGIDQIIVDEAQAFRKLSFVTNSGGIKGIDPDGSQRAWDLYVKTKYVETKRPNRALILASGTPVTNTLGEMFTIARYMNERELHQRNIHEFDAWKAMFGETVTELELQPSGTYKPVTRFAQFINVPELVAMFRTYADVVQRKDLRDLISLPRLAEGQRQIVTGEATAQFKAYQRVLGNRIRAIEERHGKPQPGDDIILSVISDGRHAAIDVRLVDTEAENDDENKLNALIRNVHRIYEESSELRYTDTDGSMSETPGAVQMIFSDLGTVAVADKRGFSAYEWIRDELIRLGVPRREIAFMQDYKKSAHKQALFTAVNRGQVRILIGSTETMGTGVNCQKRLIALHHLDVPWLPSDVEQREGRIERQGNENEAIQIYAYATPGSMDAAMWQTLERKSRFIGMAMSGDRSIRRLEDASSQANSFAIAKAIASGNPLLMQKAGLESEVARLKRLRSAHYDDQHALANTIANAKDIIRYEEEHIESLMDASSKYVPTKGDQFAMTVFGKSTRERTTGGSYLLGYTSRLKEDEQEVVGELGGLEIIGRLKRDYMNNQLNFQYGLMLGAYAYWADPAKETSAVGIVQRLEHIAQALDDYISNACNRLENAKRRMAEASARVGRHFDHEAELTEKLAKLKEIEDELVAESVRMEAERRAAEEAERAASASTPDVTVEAAAITSVAA